MGIDGVPKAITNPHSPQVARHRAGYYAFMDEEEEQWSSLRMATVALHEMFQTMMESGFEEHQALKFIALLFSEGMFQTDDDD